MNINENYPECNISVASLLVIAGPLECAYYYYQTASVWQCNPFYRN